MDIDKTREEIIREVHAAVYDAIDEMMARNSFQARLKEVGLVLVGVQFQIAIGQHEDPAPQAQNDGDFLKSLRIAPDLQVSADSERTEEAK
jgi:hypothetical protein